MIVIGIYVIKSCARVKGKTCRTSNALFVVFLNTNPVVIELE